MDAGQHPIDDVLWGHLGVTQSGLQFVHGCLFAGLAESAQALALTGGFIPEGRDWNDLFVQTCGTWTIERQAADQDNAGLRAGAVDDTGAIEAGLEAVRDETRQQAADKTMLEVDLNDTVGIAAIGQDRRCKGNRPNR